MRQRAVIAVAALGLVVATAATVAKAGVLYVKSCSVYGDAGTNFDVGGPVWSTSGGIAYSTANRCPQGGSFQIVTGGRPLHNRSAQWETITPPTIKITAASVAQNEVLIDPAIRQDGYRASFFWDGGKQAITPSSKCCGGMAYGTGFAHHLPPSRRFGWKVKCRASPQCGYPTGPQLLNVRGISLEAIDNVAPRIVVPGSNDLSDQTARWVRGGWAASFQASDDSGVCRTAMVVGGHQISGPSDGAPNQHSWTQCPTPVTDHQTIDTTAYPDGPLSLVLLAGDAAGPSNVASRTEPLHVDNQSVRLNLNGPVDAPSTGGTQYVGASAMAGPSGISGIACSEDGSPYRWHAGAAAQIPVQGIGKHEIFCYAQNNSINANGTRATSPVQGWTLSIRQPTVSAVGFASLVDALRCRQVRERVKIPAHWVRIRRHGLLVRRRSPAHSRVVAVTHCHPRVEWRKIVTWTSVTRQGKRVWIKHTKIEHVVVLPHVIVQRSERVQFGRRTAVKGWLGTSNGTALGGQIVQVLSAPDNGSGHFKAAAVARTAADGSWSARLPRGPSRLVQAVYRGGPTLEPASSSLARVIVPAVVQLRVTPSQVAWTGTVHISGRVLGGYILGTRQQLLRLRIGAEGSFSTVGIPDVRPDGRFHTTFTFHTGTGIVHYWFSVSTLNEADYPYAPGSSRHVGVTVGP